VVNCHQVTVEYTVGVDRGLRDKFIAACNGKPPWLTTALLHTVSEIKHHDVVFSGSFMDQFPEKHPRECMKQGLIPVAEATEAYIVKVIAAAHC